MTWKENRILNYCFGLADGLCACVHLCVIPFRDIPFIMCNLQYHDRCRSFLVCTILHYWIYKYNWIFKSLSHYMFYLSKKVNSNWQSNNNTGQEYTCYTLETSICLFCPSVWIPLKKKKSSKEPFLYRVTETDWLWLAQYQSNH